ncbi:hypothetical protein [Algoriphagus resistens]|uniref:hypothetical protein n=1 Tax=Algoriphagus resistens TaxID=1750590 RepID=UPI0007168D30|nr:hypothetical protein [Algoriphagus resistens]
MKKSNCFLLALLLLLLSCTSNDDDTLPKIEDSDYFIEFKANGNLIRYEPKLSSSMGFSYQPDFGIYITTILVLKDESVGNKNFISLTLRSNEAFKIGTEYDMQDAVTVTGIPQARINFTYGNEEGILHQAVLLKKPDGILPINDEFYVTFNELGQDVTGTFHGTIFKANTAITSSRPSMLITDGKFRLKKLDL